MLVSRNELMRILRIGWISSLLLGALAVAAPASAEDLSCTAVQLEGVTLSHDYRAELEREVAESRSDHLTPAVGSEIIDLKEVLIQSALLQRELPTARERMSHDRALSLLSSLQKTARRDDSKLTQLFGRLEKLKTQIETCLANHDVATESGSQRFEKSLPDSGGLKAAGFARANDRAKAQ